MISEAQSDASQSLAQIGHSMKVSQPGKQCDRENVLFINTKKRGN